MNNPSHKYALFLRSGTEIQGHGCQSKEELESYSSALGVELRVVPTDEMDAKLGYAYIVPAPAPEGENA